MMTIVEHVHTSRRYVLLGTGYGLAESSRPSFFFGALLPTEKRELHTMACVADAEGAIGWLPTQEIRVVTVDERDIASVDGIAAFLAPGERLDGPMECARCGRVISSRICPYCEGDS